MYMISYHVPAARGKSKWSRNWRSCNYRWEWLRPSGTPKKQNICSCTTRKEREYERRKKVRNQIILLWTGVLPASRTHTFSDMREAKEIGAERISLCKTLKTSTAEKIKIDVNQAYVLQNGPSNSPETSKLRNVQFFHKAWRSPNRT